MLHLHPAPASILEVPQRNPTRVKTRGQVLSKNSNDSTFVLAPDRSNVLQVDAVGQQSGGDQLRQPFVPVLVAHRRRAMLAWKIRKPIELRDRKPRIRQSIYALVREAQRAKKAWHSAAACFGTRAKHARGNSAHNARLNHDDGAGSMPGGKNSPSTQEQD